VLAVHPSLPVHDVTELIEYAKKNPGKARSVLIAMPLDSQGLFTTPRL
jgi:hypothetical protein